MTEVFVFPYWAAVSLSLVGTGAAILLSFVVLFLSGISVNLFRKLYSYIIQRGSHASNARPYVIRNPQTRDLDIAAGDDKAEEDWDVYRRQVNLIEELGEGEFGKIYDAEVMKDSQRVRALVKTFLSGSVQGMEEFKMEMERLKVFQHPNVGRLIAVLTSSVPFYTIMELPLNGALKTFLLENMNLFTNPTSQHYLTHLQLLSMGYDICNGCAYLDTLPYIHTDLATRNCFVAGDLTVKVTDYSVGRSLFTNEYSEMEDDSLMPIRWMAPESLLDNNFNSRSVVWSLGVTFWEIFTFGEFPYSYLDDEGFFNMATANFVPLRQPSGCPRELYMLMLKCWNRKEWERITITEVMELVEKILISEEETLTTKLSEYGDDIMNEISFPNND
ncbi:Insulin receptor [Oopsacas minuta]|uniref:Insulin receptor n=1 Tax=Oopsacas minuta TaxID=111878 RepID=A0AAV7JKC6_9METZ|nr:Insulin receptor [Oopsacas minuta]